MSKALGKYKLLIFYINLTVWLSLASTPLNEFFRPSLMLSRIYTVLIYLPFLLLVLWKFWGDIRKFKLNAINIAYYVFAVYYAVLTVYRFFSGMEYMESVYYALTFLGAVALFAQIYDGKANLSSEDVAKNLNGILLYTIVYKIVFTMLSVSMFGAPRVLGNPPINNLYTTSVLVMLIPFLVDSIRKIKDVANVFYWVMLCLSVVLIFICKSRAIVLLAIAVYGVLLVVNVRHRRIALNLASVAVCAALCLCALATLDVGEVRYALNRELGIFAEQETVPAQTEPVELSSEPSISPATDPVVDPSNTEPTGSELTVTEHPADALGENNLAAQEQVERSDAMRSTLLNLGIQQVLVNPVFGTGDLYYPYDLGYMTLEQTAHNFLVECLVCFGLVGTILIAVLFLSMLFGIWFFKKDLGSAWQIKVSMLVYLAYYFGLGMVQPSVFNTLVCPLFAILLAFYGTVFKENYRSDKA